MLATNSGLARFLLSPAFSPPDDKLSNSRQRDIGFSESWRVRCGGYEEESVAVWWYISGGRMPCLLGNELIATALQRPGRFLGYFLERLVADEAVDHVLDCAACA